MSDPNTNIPPPPPGFVDDTSTPSTQAPAAQSAASQNIPPPPPGFVDDDSVPTPSGNTYTPGQQPVSSSGATGLNPGTGDAAVQWKQNHPGQPYGVEGTIRANDPQNAGTAVARWAEQVANDVKYGTDFTGIGKVLKKLGAHGVDVGNSEAVGDWMASIPLGILRTVKGAGEEHAAQTPEQYTQASRDTIGGVLQAAEMPSMVFAPESAELQDLAGQAVDHAGELASKAAKTGVNAGKNAASAAGKGVAKTVSLPGQLAEKVVPGIYPPEVKLPTPAEARHSTQPIFDALHQKVRDVVANAAQNSGVAVKDSESIQDVASKVAKALKTKASNLYSQIDDALTAMADDGGDMRGRYQAVDENISKLDKKVADAIGEPEKQQQLQEALDAEHGKKQVIMQKLKDAGIDHLPKEASAAHKQAMAMEDFGRKVQQNTSGLPGHAAVPERLNPNTFANSLKALKNSTKYGGNRLQQALGDGADELIQHTNDAKAALQSAEDAAKAQAKQAADVLSKRARVKGAALTAAGLEGAHKLYGMVTGE